MPPMLPVVELPVPVPAAGCEPGGGVVDDPAGGFVEVDPAEGLVDVPLDGALPDVGA